MAIITDALPATPSYGSWIEAVEFSDTEDNSLIDFSVAEEIKMQVIDPFTGIVILTISKSTGEITTPSDGIIEWNVGYTRMRSFRCGTYEVIMNATMDSAADYVIALMKSSVSIVE